MIKGIIYDLDGTLINEDQINNGLIYSYEHNKAYLPNKTLEQFLNANSKAFLVLLKQYKARKILLSQFGILIWFTTLEILRISPKPPLVNNLYNSLQDYVINNTILNNGVLEVLNYLKSKGYKIGILSNGLFSERINRINKVKIEEFIDVLVTSDFVGKDKPALEPFEYILTKMNLNNNEVLFVGNSPQEDIGGAHNAQIRNIYYSSINAGVNCDFHISNHMEIKTILENLQKNNG